MVGDWRPRAIRGCPSTVAGFPLRGRATLEDDKHGEVLVADEAMISARGHEDGVAFPQLDRLALDLESSAAFEDDVDLVVLVRLLPVGLRGYEHVDADLEARGLVYDLVSACAGGEPLLDGLDVERVRGAHHAASIAPDRSRSISGGTAVRCGFPRMR